MRVAGGKGLGVIAVILMLLWCKGDVQAAQVALVVLVVLVMQVVQDVGPRDT